MHERPNVANGTPSLDGAEDGLVEDGLAREEVAQGLGPEHPPGLVAGAADVHRTYTLEGTGYRVVWRHIPSAITPMNRLLVARRRRDKRRDRRPVAEQPPARGAISCAPCSKEG